MVAAILLVVFLFDKKACPNARCARG